MVVKWLILSWKSWNKPQIEKRKTDAKCEKSPETVKENGFLQKKFYTKKWVALISTQIESAR